MMLLTIHASVLVLVCGVILTVATAKYNASSELNRRRRHYPLMQDGNKPGCQIPPPQPNGLFLPSRWRCRPDNDYPECQMTPGNPVPHNWVLYHSCNPGYALNNRATTVSVCYNGYWRPVLPRCIKLCPAMPSVLSVKYRCLFRGKEVSCDSEMRPGTVASAECPQFYKINYKKSCSDNGSWIVQNRSFLLMDNDSEEDENNSAIRCVPDCGISSKSEVMSNRLKSNSSWRISKPGEFTWMAIIYTRNSNGHWIMRCGGTLITRNIVLTTAYYVTDSSNQPLKPEEFRVGLGKLDINLYNMENKSGIFEVNEVKVHNLFKGTFDANDIALLSLMFKVYVSAFIMPACIDWGNEYMPVNYTSLDVAGWLYNKASHRKMMAIQMKLLRHKECERDIVSYDEEFLNKDKFCLKSVKADWLITGTGLTYEKDGRHYIAGILTGPHLLKPISDMSFIRLVTNTMFRSYAKWLKNNLGILKRNLKLSHP